MEFVYVDFCDFLYTWNITEEGCDVCVSLMCPHISSYCCDLCGAVNHPPLYRTRLRPPLFSISPAARNDVTVWWWSTNQTLAYLLLRAEFSLFLWFLYFFAPTSCMCASVPEDWRSETQLQCRDLSINRPLTESHHQTVHNIKNISEIVFSGPVHNSLSSYCARMYLYILFR